MKKSLLMMAALAVAASASAENDVITLDLSKATTPLEFNAETGAWNDTYNDDAESIVSQCFEFVHSSMGEYKTWWGFTASNSADNARKDDTLTFQFSNMAKGGIVLNEDGTVKLDDFGAPVTSAEVPYLVAYYNAYMSKRPVDVTFTEGKSYKAVGAYVNLNSYPYYCIEYGDAYARAFNNGDKYTLTIHGVASDETEKTVEVILASYDNGNLNINRGWRYVDLSELGEVNELYFSLDSTDTGEYGMNTPGYFCLDKLMVSPAQGNGVDAAMAENTKITYDRAASVINLGNADFARLYDAAGNCLMSAEGNSFSVDGLAAGVYVVKAGNSSLKFTK